MKKDLLTVAQAAERLDITRQRVYRLIEDGRLPAVIIAGHKFVQPDALVLVAERIPGRPKKTIDKSTE